MNNRENAEVLRNWAFTLKDGTKYMKEEHEKQFREAYEEAIKALEQTEWIPATERLPEKSGLYLVSTGDLVTTLSFCGHSFRTHFADEYGVDAWRPLPEPYKGDAE